jgi:hypothetical protein
MNIQERAVIVGGCHFESKGEIREEQERNFYNPVPPYESIRDLHNNKTDRDFMDILSEAL